MEERQKNIRERLNTFIEKSGRKACWVCEQCNLDVSLISRFRKGKRDLWEESLSVLEQFLQKYDNEV